jgi:hypothetical protein
MEFTKMNKEQVRKFIVHQGFFSIGGKTNFFDTFDEAFNFVETLLNNGNKGAIFLAINHFPDYEETLGHWFAGKEIDVIH